MKRLITFVAYAVFVLGAAASTPCQAFFNDVSGVITASSDYGLDCTYNLSPPSDEYKYVTLQFTYFSVKGFVAIHDGPSNSSEVISKMSGLLGALPGLSTSQAYATIRWVSDFPGYGWTLTYQYHKQQAPVCAGPKWITDFEGTIEYNLIGTASDAVECQWIFNMYLNQYTGNCAMLHLSALSWEDNTQSAVISGFSGASPYFFSDGSMTEDSQDDLFIDIPLFDLSATLTSSVATFEGSSTKLVFNYTYEYYGICSGPDDLSSSSSSSGSEHHPWFWVTIAFGGTVAVLAAVMIGLIWRAKHRKNDVCQVAEEVTPMMVGVQLVPVMPQYAQY